MLLYVFRHSIGTFYLYTLNPLTQLSEIDIFFIPRLKIRELRGYAQGYTTSKGRSQHSITILPTETVLFIMQ